MDAEKRLRLTPQLVLGLLVIVVGVIFSLENLGYIYADEFLRFWPLGLIVLGAVKFAQAEGTPGRIAGFFFLFVGVVLLLDSLTGIEFDPFRYWPLILVFIGGLLVWQALTRSSGDEREGREQDASSYVRSLVILGGIERSNSSPDFRGGEVTAVMGGCEIDLRKACIIADQAVVSVFTLWGGIGIRVPEEWTVVQEGFPILGGIVDKTRPSRDADVHPQRLVIRGMAIMGGVEIKN